MNNKKAIEIQFNWLFILVAGAAIILFFTVITTKQKGVSEVSIKATILKSIDAIIISSSVSTDTINKIKIPSSDIEIDCGKIAVGGVSKQYQNLILFAPNLIKGDQILTQTLGFSAPYKSANLLYSTSLQMRYVIIGTSNLAKEINKTLPSDLKKEFYPSNPQIRNSNNYKVQFVIFGNMIEFPKALDKMPDWDVTAIKIDGDAEKGTIEYFQKKDDSWISKGSSFYLGKQSLIGAIYTDSLDIYECNMRNAFSRLILVTTVYADKVNKLIENASASNKQMYCVDFYKNALPQLRNTYNAASNLAKSSSFNVQDVAAIAAAASLVAQENKNTQDNSCPLIY